MRQLAMGYFQGGLTARSKTHRYIARVSSPYPPNGADTLSQQEFYNLTQSQDPVRKSIASETSELLQLIEQLPWKE